MRVTSLPVYVAVKHIMMKSKLVQRSSFHSFLVNSEIDARKVGV